MSKYMKVHPDLLRDACLLHGFFDGARCALCEVLNPDRYYSAGPYGNIPAEPARHAHHKARRSEQAGLANSPCPETESS